MAEIALAQEPLEVAVGGRTDALTPERRLLAAIAHRVRLVALPAMVAVEQSAGRNGFGPAGERIGARVIPGGNVPPGRSGTGGERDSGQQSCAAQGEFPSCLELPDPPLHRTPPFDPRNHSLT